MGNGVRNGCRGRTRVFSARREESNNGSDDGSESESVNDGDDFSSDGDHAESFVDMRQLDKDEVKSVQHFSRITCGCTKREGVPCSGYFTVEELSELRMQMAELENEQSDLVILSQINAHHFTGKIGRT